jgi:hypothetical protein
VTELETYIRSVGPATVAAQISALPGWRLFNMLWKCPDDLIRVCNGMGFQTVDDVQAWVTATLQVPKAEQFAMLTLAPTQWRDYPFPSVSWVEMDGARQAQCASDSDYKRFNSDATYRVPTKTQLESIAQECWSHRWKHLNIEALDCDDHTNIARGWLSANGLGNLAAGKAATWHYQGDKFLGAHALLLAYSRETPQAPLVCHWWEPQNGRLYPVTYAKLGGFITATRTGLVWSDF